MTGQTRRLRTVAAMMRQTAEAWKLIVTLEHLLAASQRNPQRLWMLLPFARTTSTSSLLVMSVSQPTCKSRVPTGPEKSSKVLKFDFSFFRTWKVLKLDIGAENVMKKSWFLLVYSWKTKIMNPRSEDFVRLTQCTTYPLKFCQYRRLM